jgi:protein-disulfide isomerase
MSPAKKLFLILIIVIAGAGLLFYRQIEKAKNIIVESSRQPLIEPNAVDIPMAKDAPLLGNPGAPLTIVEFIDLGSSKCQSVHAKLVKFVSEHPMDVRLIWKDAPEQGLFLKGNNLAHQAAYCAISQKQFWKYVDLVLRDTKNVREAELTKIAENLGFEMIKWWQCANSELTRDKISAAVLLAQQLDVDATPVIFINNKKINLTEDIDLSQMLNSFIEK